MAGWSLLLLLVPETVITPDRSINITQHHVFQSATNVTQSCSCVRSRLILSSVFQPTWEH